MDRVISISFAAALVELQPLLHQRVCVRLSASASLCGCAISGVLERVNTLQPDNEAVELVVGEQAIYLDPEDVTAQFIRDPEGRQILEFSIPTGMTICVERLPNLR